MTALIEHLLSWALGLISQFGYWGIFVTMGLDSIAVPIPSEVVLPFAGFLAFGGSLDLWGIIFVATLSNIAGALIAYYVGRFLGRPLLERYGRYVFIKQGEINRIEHWLEHYEHKAVFFSRLIPGIRTYSSLVMGAINRLQLGWFIFYTALGSLVWSFAFTYFGYVAGERWSILGPYFKKIELVIAAVILAVVIWFVYHHVKKK